MPQSLSQVVVHVVFSTKNRDPHVDPGVREPLHAYLATVCRGTQCLAYRVGGTADHVHLVVALSRTIAVSQLIEKIKKPSSKWMKMRGQQYQSFYWQHGYGAFSVSPTHLKEVVAYVDKQETHHQKVSFQDEYRRFLRRYAVPFDERYVWD